MRIPFLKRRKVINTLYSKGILNEYELNSKAQQRITTMFIDGKRDLQGLVFIFEQVYIIYALSAFSGSHIVNDIARKALVELNREYNEKYQTSMSPITAVACSKALKEGVPVIEELPRSEYKLAYVQAKKLTQTHQSIINYLRLFT